MAVSINKAVVLGRLGRDPEARTTSSGMTVVSLAVATSSRKKLADGSYDEQTEWHNVSVFGKQADVARKFLRKGSEVYIEGRFHTRKYTGKDGIERFRTEILCDSLQLGSRPRAGEAPAEPSPQIVPAAPQNGGNYDDIPF